jgi:ribosomal subunit interface protein
MQVIVKSRHTNVSEPIKEMAEQKLEKVQRLLGKVTALEVEFSEEHNPRIADKHIVEVTLTTKAHLLRAHASGADPMTALDSVVHKLEAQVKRLKDKRVARGSRTTRNGSARALTADSVSPGDLDGAGGALESEDGSEESQRGFRRTTEVSISRSKRFALKPMTAEEAVLQMESLGHDFYLFVNAESEQTGVVYRRRDGSFGLIEPD